MLRRLHVRDKAARIALGRSTPVRAELRLQRRDIHLAATRRGRACGLRRGTRNGGTRGRLGVTTARKAS